MVAVLLPPPPPSKGPAGLVPLIPSSRFSLLIRGDKMFALSLVGYIKIYEYWYHFTIYILLDIYRKGTPTQQLLPGTHLCTYVHKIYWYVYNLRGENFKCLSYFIFKI